MNGFILTKKPSSVTTSIVSSILPRSLLICLLTKSFMTSCPTNSVIASFPTTSLIRNCILTCILVKSPSNSFCMISNSLPTSISSSSAIVSPMTLNDHGFRGALIEYHLLDFHLSFCLRAAALADAPLAIETSPYCGGYPVCEPCDLQPVFERNAKDIGGYGTHSIHVGSSDGHGPPWRRMENSC